MNKQQKREEEKKASKACLSVSDVQSAEKTYEK